MDIKKLTNQARTYADDVKTLAAQVSYAAWAVGEGYETDTDGGTKFLLTDNLAKLDLKYKLMRNRIEQVIAEMYR